jgi:hypothetical protein
MKKRFQVLIVVVFDVARLRNLVNANWIVGADLFRN